MRLITHLVLLLCLTSILAGCQKAEEPPTADITATSMSSESPGQTGLPEISKLESANLFTTAKDTDLRLAATGDVLFRKGSQPREDEISIFVNPQVRFQTMLGFGGAITDASSEVFAKLSAAK